MGEERLRKKGADYLGWQTAKTKFTLCDKKLIDIGDGNVEKSQDKCAQPPGPAPITWIQEYFCQGCACPGKFHIRVSN